MDTNNQIPATPGPQPVFSQRMQHSKALIAIAAVLGVTVMALAAALVVNRSDAQPGGTDAKAPMTQSSTTAKLASDTTTPAKPAPAKPAVQQRPVVVAQAPVQAPAPKPVVCADCGTVEAVTPVQRQGEVNGVAVGNSTIGLGTVAGGVVGGLLGNQVGGGSGKTAMTVLGAAGGAFAGNQIEKNMKKVTVYQVRVRMNDGSTRTVEVSSSVPVGSRVIVEGNNLRMA
ncbi:MAG: glycine zipper 2TM domain-containing protein [Polaromonas sp.]|uniref:glycine zipper 2TM domain-containing protein n=1 Tax=Polaromonas sp. TaxID=1869339 RepID=UPI0027304B0E|nr:glycine zipper 2TM domain-containing protein [Polaromonas sp.]MDP1741588.1 glycine zipper 2TM domain-containing protein [Polaromonas sp.]MDP1953506.1 glycine zipper 2TM domain-containing protein [Polaromonas sp.]MDP3355553.1 glycine zipper 2TM domain-containing protein [Polaromonas sp.]MDP3752533.1 glycine zipper 2TM domain-containing protein [Polaromonas sp.]